MEANFSGNRIRELRKLKKKPGTEIAKRLGISAPYYYDIEKGKRTLSADMAAQLADIFGVSMDYLTGRDTGTDEANEVELLQKLELNDDDIMDEFELTLDGEPITEEEARSIIAFLRTSRQMKKK